MKLPIIITKDWDYSNAIYRTHIGVMSWGRGKVVYQVWLWKPLEYVVSTPERIWRHILCRLWLDRLSYQYERGFADGLKEALENREAYDALPSEELAAIKAGPSTEEK